MPTREPGAWMWAEACELLERAERLNRQFFQPRPAEARRPAWEPPVDVLETDSELWILVALPGVGADRVEVLVQDGTLVVAGERPMPGRARAGIIRRLEIPYGHFERRIELPPGRFDVMRRELVDGCLVLGLRKL
jgi:HSP20 family protein